MKLDFGALPKRIGKSLQRVFGSANQRMVSRYQPIVDKVNELAGWAADQSEEQIRAQVASWRKQVQEGSITLDDVVPEMFALIREASTRTLGLRHFDVQLLGGLVLHDGNIAEMVTGEGKTLVATLPAALNALSGRGVFVVTVNDYLAKRDRDWMAPVFEYLGLSVGAVQSNMGPSERHPQYACDITYGTNNEFGFDYLRDNMKWRAEDQVQKDLNFAIVDEVDSILVDEARTPLIISGPPEGKADKYATADRIARALKEGDDYEVKLKEQQCLLTEAGVAKAEKMAGVESFYADPENMSWPHHIEQSLRAHYIYNRDKEYVVGQNPRTGRTEVIIVDEFTGRLMAGRRWSDGLHQAVEVKEGLKPQEESQVLATITLQNYFRMFDKLAGMTGTAMTEAGEFSKIYDLDVVSVPTNKPMQRADLDDLVYLNEEDKHNAIVEDVREENAKGRPILVGTTSIAKSERLSEELGKAGIEHKVLNAKFHEKEAEIIAQAGAPGAVTVATNMAGRGTDIVLGGNPEMLLRGELKEQGVEYDPQLPEHQARLAELQESCEQRRKEILELGGLMVVGTERHEARRIDNQLRGRCGRQGDPGMTRFYLCFDDDLMKIFARDWVKTMMEKLGLKSGEVIESGMVTRGIERAQKKVESRNFDIRKNLLEYDEVMDKQRKFIYTERAEVLAGEGFKEKVLDMFANVLDAELAVHAGDKDQPIAFDEIEQWLRHKTGDQVDWSELRGVERDGLLDWILGKIEALYGERAEHYGQEDWERTQKFLLLDTIDKKWKDHLFAMEVLKAGIGLRGYAQVDPKNEYKKEGYEKFELLKEAIADQVTNLIFKVELAQEQIAAPRRVAPPAQPPDPATAKAMIEAMIAAGQAPPEVIEAYRKGGQIQVGRPGDAARKQQVEAQRKAAEEKRQKEQIKQDLEGKKPGRNDPCPCGSGVKYKKCCHPAFG